MFEFKGNVAFYEQNPKELINDIVDIIGEDFPGGLGFRGIYKEELGLTELEPSREWLSEDDDVRDAVPGEEIAIMGRELDGTSCMEITGNWEYAEVSELKKKIVENIGRAVNWGNTDYIAVVKGQPAIDEVWEDAGEIVLSSAEVIGYIKKGDC